MGGDKLLHPAAQSRNFLDQATADVGQLLAGHQKKRLEIWLQLAVHQRQLELKLKIADRTKPANERYRIQFAGKIDQEPLKGKHPNLGHLARRLAKQLHPFIEGKEAFLGVVLRNRNNQFIKQPAGPCNDIEMSIGDGVKASGIEGAAHDEAGVWTQEAAGSAAESAAP